MYRDVYLIILGYLLETLVEVLHVLDKERPTELKIPLLVFVVIYDMDHYPVFEVGLIQPRENRLTGINCCSRLVLRGLTSWRGLFPFLILLHDGRSIRIGFLILLFSWYHFLIPCWPPYFQGVIGLWYEFLLYEWIIKQWVIIGGIEWHSGIMRGIYYLTYRTVLQLLPIRCRPTTWHSLNLHAVIVVGIMWEYVLIWCMLLLHGYYLLHYLIGCSSYGMYDFVTTCPVGDVAHLFVYLWPFLCCQILFLL